jgi:hypothetical protein
LCVCARAQDRGTIAEYDYFKLQRIGVIKGVKHAVRVAAKDGRGGEVTEWIDCEPKKLGYAPLCWLVLLLLCRSTAGCACILRGYASSDRSP